MFKVAYNRALVRLRLVTVTPLLVRAGDVGLDPSAADLCCVRTRHAEHGVTVYVPGSSLKGVVRSAAEATVRGSRYHDVEGACDPLDSDCCGSKVQRNRRREDGPRGSALSPAVHRSHCLACRLFGSTAMRGRASVRDLFPWSASSSPLSEDDRRNLESANRLELRHNVAINRVSGHVAHGPFDMEMIPAGVYFCGEIAMTNYQVWQLGLLGAAIGEINDGFAQLGSSKSRGLGVARAEVESIVHEQPARLGERPLGVGAVEGADAQVYGLLPEADIPAADSHQRGLHRRFVAADPEAAAEWMAAGREALGRLA